MTISPRIREIIESALAWRAQDPDPQTAAELDQLIEMAKRGDDAAAEELADAFNGTLEFGTAGLRGRLGPGPNRMNRVVVIRAAAGLAQYLLSRAGTSVVVGYDARHNSDVFARDTAEIMAGAGVKAYLLPRALPTPVLAYAIRPLGCAAGVMVTASHNPPRDNGYKVYLDDGSQIIPPADSEISACIAAVGPISHLPRNDGWDLLDEAIPEAYKQRAVSLLADGPRDIRAVYTPMHGVGGVIFQEAAAQAGFPVPAPVTEQFEPDADFPTVAFPNPEEPGAMDLAMAAAREHNAEIIIANDPDADRCAAGIPADGDWRMLTGDESGALLGWWLLARARQTGEALTGTYAASVVSGTLLSRIAGSGGLDFQTTLTGFKWISKVPGLIFGYEEALGICADPAAVKDKDGISASLLMLELAADLKSKGQTVQDALDSIAREFGLHSTSQIAFRVTDIQLIKDAMARLRGDPPIELAGRGVISVDDLLDGGNGVPPTDGMRFKLAGARVIVRPSGTEPKLKCYLEVVVPVSGAVADARAVAEAEINELRTALSDLLRL